MWCSEALKQLRAAIQLDPSYKTDQKLIEAAAYLPDIADDAIALVANVRKLYEAALQASLDGHRAVATNVSTASSSPPAWRL